MTFSHAGGESADTVHSDQELLGDAYTAELAAFLQAVRSGTPATVNGEDAWQALAIALAAIESLESGRPAAVEAMPR